MNRRSHPRAPIVALLLALVVPAVQAQAVKRIAILYDGFGPPSALVKDRGFAALILGEGRLPRRHRAH